MNTTMTPTAAPTAATFDDPPVPVRTKLAAAWASFMFLYIYVDYFHLYKPGAIDDLRSGVVFEFDIDQSLLTIFLVLVSVPALMILLSTTLPVRATRVANLVVAALYVLVSAFNAVGESWTYFYGLSIGVEVLILAFILRSVWTWPRTSPRRAD